MNRINKVFILLLCLTLYRNFTSYAQELELIDSISIPTPARASIDQLNNIYIVDEKGNINKYDKEGKISLQYSPQQLADITLIEAWNPLKIFVFYQDFQEYLFLDRFLTATSRFSTRDFGNYIGFATISADNNIWCIDYSDFSLKKYDVNLNQVILTTPLNLILNQDYYEIRFIREYQNLLFISDYRSGLFIFDNIGNYLRKLDLKEVDYISFSEDKICSSNDTGVTITNIYNSKSQYFHFNEDVLFTFFLDDQLMVLTKSKLKRYKVLLTLD